MKWTNKMESWTTNQLRFLFIVGVLLGGVSSWCVFSLDTILFPDYPDAVEWDVNTYFEDDPGPPTGWSADHWECFKANRELQRQVGLLEGKTDMAGMEAWCFYADSIAVLNEHIDSVDGRICELIEWLQDSAISWDSLKQARGL